MFNLIEDDTRPFDYLERIGNAPIGTSARIVRIAGGLPFDATVILPANQVPADVNGEHVGDNIVMHRKFDNLACAEDWLIAWLNR